MKPGTGLFGGALLIAGVHCFPVTGKGPREPQMSAAAHGSYITGNIHLLEQIGNGKINGGSNSGVLTTFELLNDHAEKSNREPGCIRGNFKALWMSLPVLGESTQDRSEGRDVAVLAAAPLPSEGEPGQQEPAAPPPPEIPAGGSTASPQRGEQPGPVYPQAYITPAPRNHAVPRNWNASNVFTPVLLQQ